MTSCEWLEADSGGGYLHLGIGKQAIVLRVPGFCLFFFFKSQVSWLLDIYQLLSGQTQDLNEKVFLIWKLTLFADYVSGSWLQCRQWGLGSLITQCQWN